MKSKEKIAEYNKRYYSKNKKKIQRDRKLKKEGKLQRRCANPKCKKPLEYGVNMINNRAKVCCSGVPGVLSECQKWQQANYKKALYQKKGTYRRILTYNSKPKIIQVAGSEIQEKERVCLCCEKPFLSLSKFNRICSRCKTLRL